MNSYLKLPAVLAAILLSVTATHAAPAGPVTVYNSMADLTNLPPTRGQVSIVTGLDESNPFPTPLIFTHNPTSAVGTAQFPMRAVAKGNTNGLFIANPRWSFKGMLADEQRAEWWGIKGDGLSDNSTALNLLLSYCKTNAVRVVFPRGRYLHSSPLSYTGNYPLNWQTDSGTFRSGWYGTNEITETRFIYTGTNTTAAFSVSPASGLVYGVNLDKITVDANGKAGTAIYLKNATRGVLNQIRARNSTQNGIVLDNTVYMTVISPSVSANEEPFSTSPAVGILLTNAANANFFVNAAISGTTNWGVNIVEGVQGSYQNKFIGGGIESNLGGGVHIAQNCNFNSFENVWFENNTDTNRYFVIDAGALQNRVVGLKFENRVGKLYLDGAYNTISDSVFGQLELGSSAGHNRLQDLILDVSQQPYPLKYAWNQIINNVIDATAALHMNIMPDAWTVYGTNIWMYDTSTNRPYPMAALARDSILWGDGTRTPTAGWTMYSTNSLSTPNTILFLRSGVSDGVFTVYAPGDTYPRVSLNTDTTYATGPGGSTPVDTSFYRLSSRTWLSSGSWLITRPTTNSSVIGSYMDGGAFPMFYVYANGTINWGTGLTNADVSLFRAGPGVLQLNNDLTLNGGITLGGVYRSTWPGGTTYTGTNGVTVAGSVISANIAAGANITLSTNGSGQISIASTGSGGATNGTPVSVNAGGTMAAANLQSSTNITVTGSGTNISFVVTNSGVTPGSYTSANITVGEDGRIISAANGTGGGGDVYQNGTNTFTGTNTFQGKFIVNNGGAGATYAAGINLGIATNTETFAVGPRSSTATFTNAVALTGGTNTASSQVAIGGALAVASTITGVNTYFAGNQAKIANGSLGSGTRNFAVMGTATNNDAVAIGTGANTGVYTNAYALGLNSTSTNHNTITLGTSSMEIISQGPFKPASTILLNGTAGSAGQILTSTGTGAAWSNAPSITGSTNGTPVSVNAGGVLAAANLQSTTNITVTATTTNVTFTVTNSGVTPGAYTSANITVGADGRIISAANGSGGGGGSGTNIFVNNTLVQPAKLTNTTEVAVGTNANGDIKFTLGTVTNTIAFRNNTNTFTATNTFADKAYLQSDLVFVDESLPGTNDLFGFYQSGTKLYGWSGSSSNTLFVRNIWLAIDRSGVAPTQVGDITITSLGTITLQGNTTVLGTFTNTTTGAKQLTAGTNLILGGTVSAAGSYGTNGQVLTSTGTGVNWTTLTAPPGGMSSASTASFTPDFSVAKAHEFTLTNTATLNAPTNVSSSQIGEVFRLVLIQDSTGNRTLTLATNYLFGTDITGVTLTTNSGARDYMSVYVRRTNVFDVVGFLRGYAQ